MPIDLELDNYVPRPYARHPHRRREGPRLPRQPRLKIKHLPRIICTDCGRLYRTLLAHLCCYCTPGYRYVNTKDCI